MSFALPQFLYLAIILIPLAILFLAWAERARRKALHKIGQPRLVARLAALVNTRGRMVKYALWVGGLALLLVALARPQWGETKTSAPQQGVQVMVALDVSKSMLAEDVKPNRLTRAKMEIGDLMNRLKGDEIGLVPFSGASFILFPLTSDYNTARSFLDTARPGIVSRGGTAIGDAIRTAMTGFDPKRNSQKVIVVVTDGEDTESNALQAAQDAAKNGAIIYTIGFGSAQGALIPKFDENGNQIGYVTDAAGNQVRSDLNEDALREIASATGGRYFPATANGSELDALAAELDRLQKGDIVSRETVEKHEQFQWFLAPALLLFVLGELIPERKRQTANGKDQLGFWKQWVRRGGAA
ncbi:VWA domain-containing protein [Anaerolineae bacterium CFX7]|nr:VWA domain-containing protein [Anaerolineae bacterium CFX7]